MQSYRIFQSLPRVSATCSNSYNSLARTIRQPASFSLIRFNSSKPVKPIFSESLQTSSSSSNTTPSHLSDPFPLPFSPEIVEINKTKHAGVNLASYRQTIDGINTPIRVDGRESEDRKVKLARLIYQCRKRGTLETDLILSTFAKKELQLLEDKELDEFDRLLDEPDWDIFYWCTQRKPVPERWQQSFQTQGRLGWRLVKHTKNEERAVRWMPEL